MLLHADQPNVFVSDLARAPAHIATSAPVSFALRFAAAVGMEVGRRDPNCRDPNYTAALCWDGGRRAQPHALRDTTSYTNHYATR